MTAAEYAEFVALYRRIVDRDWPQCPSGCKGCVTCDTWGAMEKGVGRLIELVEEMRGKQ